MISTCLIPLCKPMLETRILFLGPHSSCRSAWVMVRRSGGLRADSRWRDVRTICQFVLTDDSVSKFHAALIRTPLGVWVIDLLAREGTYVNGERVSWAWLGDGDTFANRLVYVHPSLRNAARADQPR